MKGRKDEADIHKMIQRVMQFNSNLTEDKQITISMEFERPRQALVPLMSSPDVVGNHVDGKTFLVLMISLLFYSAVNSWQNF